MSINKQSNRGKASKTSTSQFTIPNTAKENIYEGGNLRQIRIEELVGNELAITQLVNDYNVCSSEVKSLQNQLNIAETDLKLQKTSPFVSILGGFVNILGSVILSFSINKVSSESQKDGAFWLFLVLGGILVLIASLSSILYPFAIRFFNKKNANSQEW